MNLSGLVGLVFFALAAVQWYAPRVRHFSSAARAGVERGELDARDVGDVEHVFGRVFAFCAMVMSGFFLGVAWTRPTLSRLYSFAVHYVPG